MPILHISEDTDEKYQLSMVVAVDANAIAAPQIPNAVL
jgi:hypothetical protein